MGNKLPARPPGRLAAARLFGMFVFHSINAKLRRGLTTPQMHGVFFQASNDDKNILQI